MLKVIRSIADINNCQPEHGMALFELTNLFNGKWKFVIISVLLHEKRRFAEIQKLTTGITPRMLSKELKELELNGIVYRKVVNTSPVIVKYGCTDSAKKLEEPFSHLLNWAVRHHQEHVRGSKQDSISDQL